MSTVYVYKALLRLSLKRVGCRYKLAGSAVFYYTQYLRFGRGHPL